MKSITTDMSYKGCDELRSACGGAGYHMSSGVANAFTEHSVLATFEGVNVLMTQQSSRYILK
jgi:alkylation response protein AidB-like acyl-CoA dehydrogenase